MPWQWPHTARCSLVCRAPCPCSTDNYSTQWQCYQLLQMNLVNESCVARFGWLQGEHSQRCNFSGLGRWAHLMTRACKTKDTAIEPCLCMQVDPFSVEAGQGQEAEGHQQHHIFTSCCPDISLLLLPGQQKTREGRHWGSVLGTGQKRSHRAAGGMWGKAGKCCGWLTGRGEVKVGMGSQWQLASPSKQLEAGMI